MKFKNNNNINGCSFAYIIEIYTTNDFEKKAIIVNFKLIILL